MPTIRQDTILTRDNGSEETIGSEIIGQWSELPEPTPIPEPTPEPTPEPVPVLFRDTFDFVANRDENVKPLFGSRGWSTVKAENSDFGQGGAHGYIYTVDQIPGSTQSFPNGVSRVLCLEADRHRNLDWQANFYLQYGVPHGLEVIPADLWVSFWIYNQNTPEQPCNNTSANKFMYVCSGDYPCQDEKWMLITSNWSGPYRDELSNGVQQGDVADLYFSISNGDKQGDVMDNQGSLAGAFYGSGELGDNLTDGLIPQNEWTQVKIHLDTSTPDRKFEMWTRPLNGQYTKVAEWINGVNCIFTGRVGGHSTFALPGIVEVGNYYHLYLSDFIMSDSEL